MRLVLAIAAVLALAGSVPANAKGGGGDEVGNGRHAHAVGTPCRDGLGRFARCPTVAHSPVCKVGKPCGNSCIAKNKVCHKG